MNDIIRWEEKAHFLTEKKDIVDGYAKNREEQGYKVQVLPASPRGWVVISELTMAMSE